METMKGIHNSRRAHRGAVVRSLWAAMISMMDLILAPGARAEDSQTSSEMVEAVRLTVELADGSRLLGAPIDSGLTWKTGLGPLALNWHLLKSADRIDSGDKFSMVFRNGDHAGGIPEAGNFALRTMLGDLTVPLAVTRRIRVDPLAAGVGPVAYWSFNDPANLGADGSGHGHVLTVVGAESTDGRIGKGAATGGGEFGRYFRIDSHPDLQFSGDFTLAVWALRSAPMFDGDQLIAKEGEFYLRRYQIPTERYDVELLGKNGLQLAKVSDTKSGLPLNEWTLIVVCRKEDRLSIRVNDLPTVETKVAEGETGGDKPFYIGSSVVGYPWQGKVDEIRKWNHALSEDEQRELFRNAPAMPEAPREGDKLLKD